MKECSGNKVQIVEKSEKEPLNPSIFNVIWTIIIFDELELIIFVSQGLTLSTASLVLKPLFMVKNLSLDNWAN